MLCFLFQTNERADNYFVLPIEVKSRVSNNTSEEMKRRLCDHVGIDEYEESDEYMFAMSATDPSFLKLIGSTLYPQRPRHEAMQLLHHAFVFGSNEALMLIGNHNKFSFAIRVTFPSDLMRAYKVLMNTFFDKWFKIFFVEDLKDLPQGRIEKALEIRNRGKKKRDFVDLHSFMTNYKLWRSLNVNVTLGIRFPLPPMTMIIPFVNAFWNVTKGPSDTMTRLLDTCEENLGIRNPQSVAVARLMALQGVAFHRTAQFITSKNPNYYGSLKSFRDAANHRLPFQKSMSIIIHFLKNDLSSLERSQQSAPLPPLPVTPPPRRTTRNTKKVEAVKWQPKSRTNCTPITGRRKKTPDDKTLTDDARSAACVGLVPLLSAKRLTCRLCGSRTFYICSWCKRPLCMTKGRLGEEKIQIYKDRCDVNDEEPAAMVSLTQYDPKKGELVKKEFINTCYHIAHSKQWEVFFAGLYDDDNKGIPSTFDEYLHTLNEKNKEN